jgi:hypothetical protein
MLIKLINGDPLESPTYKMQTQLIVRSSCQPLSKNPTRQPERYRHTARKRSNDGQGKEVRAPSNRK